MFILIFKISDLSYLVHLSFFRRRRAPLRRAPHLAFWRSLTKNFYINIQKIWPFIPGSSSSCSKDWLRCMSFGVGDSLGEILKVTTSSGSSSTVSSFPNDGNVEVCECEVEKGWLSWWVGFSSERITLSPISMDNRRIFELKKFLVITKTFQ